MYITPISYKDAYKPAFSSNNITGLRKNGMIYHTITSFFRFDMDWEHLAKFLGEKYASEKSVNILNLACSDGSEPISLAIILQEKLGKEASKFFPIKASDFDETMISRASSRVYNVTLGDLNKIRQFTNYNLEKYFKILNNQNIQSKEILSEKINFSLSNMLDELENLKPANNVILCRNCLPYLPAEERKFFIDTLGRKLDNTSCVITGKMEKELGCTQQFEANGFKESNVENVYVKNNYLIKPTFRP